MRGNVLFLNLVVGMFGSWVLRAMKFESQLRYYILLYHMCSLYIDHLTGSKLTTCKVLWLLRLEDKHVLSTRNRQGQHEVFECSLMIRYFWWWKLLIARDGLQQCVINYNMNYWHWHGHLQSWVRCHSTGTAKRSLCQPTRSQLFFPQKQLS